MQQVPSLSAKSLDGKQIQLLLSNPATTNPLFLLVALEELRGFGSFEELNDRIQAFPRTGDTVTELFEQVLERLEIEFGEDLVRSLFQLLASARRGLSEPEQSTSSPPSRVWQMISPSGGLSPVGSGKSPVSGLLSRFWCGLSAW